MENIKTLPIKLADCKIGDKVITKAGNNVEVLDKNIRGAGIVLKQSRKQKMASKGLFDDTKTIYVYVKVLDDWGQDEEQIVECLGNEEVEKIIKEEVIYLK